MNLRLDVFLKETGPQNVMIRLDTLLKVRRFYKAIEVLLAEELEYQAEQIEKQQNGQVNAHPHQSR